MTKNDVPLRLAIMRRWVGEKEVQGAKANPVIAGKETSWFSLVDYPEIKSDEIANCAAAVGASLVLETFCSAGYDLLDFDNDDPAVVADAREALRHARAVTPLPARELRLLARGYSDFGIDVLRDPQPGDLIIVPRGVAWQGHIMQIDEVQSSLRRYKCIGANQRDETSIAYVGFDADIVAIRRPVAATAKELLAAGSKGVARGVALKRVGDTLTVGTPLAAGAAKIAEKLTDAAPAVPVAPPAPLPDVSTIEGMKTATEHLGIVQAFSDALVAFGMLFVRYPWLVVPIGAGILIRVYGVEAITARVRSHIAGLPINTQKEQPA